MRSDRGTSYYYDPASGFCWDDVTQRYLFFDPTLNTYVPYGGPTEQQGKATAGEPMTKDSSSSETVTESEVLASAPPSQGIGKDANSEQGREMKADKVTGKSMPYESEEKKAIGGNPASAEGTSPTTIASATPVELEESPTMKTRTDKDSATSDASSAQAKPRVKSSKSAGQCKMHEG